MLVQIGSGLTLKHFNQAIGFLKDRHVEQQVAVAMLPLAHSIRSGGSSVPAANPGGAKVCRWMFADAGHSLPTTKLCHCIGAARAVRRMIQMNRFRWSQMLT